MNIWSRVSRVEIWIFEARIWVKDASIWVSEPESRSQRLESGSQRPISDPQRLESGSQRPKWRALVTNLSSLSKIWIILPGFRPIIIIIIEPWCRSVRLHNFNMTGNGNTKHWNMYPAYVLCRSAGNIHLVRSFSRTRISELPLHWAQYLSAFGKLMPEWIGLTTRPSFFYST